jgi:hypothetical protein
MKIRTVILFVILVLGLTFTVRLVTDTRQESVSDPESDGAVAHGNQSGIAGQDPGANTHLNRYRVGEYFDVPLNERRSIQNASQGELVVSYRSRLDENFDVPLSERDRNWNASLAPSPAYRSPLDECFDVPLSERAGCWEASQATTP